MKKYKYAAIAATVISMFPAISFATDYSGSCPAGMALRITPAGIPKCTGLFIRPSPSLAPNLSLGGAINSAGNIVPRVLSPLAQGTVTSSGQPAVSLPGTYESAPPLTTSSTDGFIVGPAGASSSTLAQMAAHRMRQMAEAGQGVQWGSGQSEAALVEQARSQGWSPEYMAQAMGVPIDTISGALQRYDLGIGRERELAGRRAAGVDTSQTSWGLDQSPLGISLGIPQRQQPTSQAANSGPFTVGGGTGMIVPFNPNEGMSLSSSWQAEWDAGNERRRAGVQAMMAQDATRIQQQWDVANSPFVIGPTPAPSPFVIGPTPAPSPFVIGPTPAPSPFVIGPTPAPSPFVIGPTPAPSPFVVGPTPAPSPFVVGPTRID